MSLVEAHRPQLSFCLFVDGARFKRRLPVILREQNGGVCIALVGNLFRMEAIHILALVLSILGAIGSIASIISLICYVCDKVRDKKK